MPNHDVQEEVGMLTILHMKGSMLTKYIWYPTRISGKMLLKSAKKEGTGNTY